MAALNLVYKVFPLITASGYGALLLYLLCRRDGGALIKSVFIPAFALAAATVIRKALNFQRPYEKLDIKPLIPKNRKGCSFPSRHCVSSFVISVVLLYTNVPAGVASLAVSLLTAASRCLAGVHFLRDVAAGSALGILFGLVIFFI